MGVTHLLLKIPFLRISKNWIIHLFQKTVTLKFRRRKMFPFWLIMQWLRLCLLLLLKRWKWTHLKCVSNMTGEAEVFKTLPTLSIEIHFNLWGYTEARGGVWTHLCFAWTLSPSSKTDTSLLVKDIITKEKEGVLAQLPPINACLKHQVQRQQLAKKCPESSEYPSHPLSVCSHHVAIENKPVKTIAAAVTSSGPNWNHIRH